MEAIELVQSSKIILDAESDSKLNELKYNQSMWTMSALVDELTFNLCIFATYEIDLVTKHIIFNHKYIDSGRQNLFYVNIVEDPSKIVFKIDRRDLKPKIISELAELDSESRNTVITEAVARVYESINYQYFHKNGIHGKIRWELV